MRIAHVSDCYAPRAGGIESQVKALALQQRAAGRDVRVITATPAREGRGALVDDVGGVPVHRVTASIPFDLPIHPRTRREVLRLLLADPVDVVHVHAGVISPFAWGAVRAARDAGIPVLVTVHSVWGGMARPAFGVSDALVRWHDWGVTLSAVSELAASRVQAAIPGAGRVLVLSNGIDPDAWSVEPRGAAPGHLRIATVMRLAPRKRTLPLLRMIALARRGLEGTTEVTATVVGDGPMRDRAERYVAEHRLESAVTFAGRLDREGVRDVLAASDVYLQPSIKESFGLAALEARTVGLPVIVRSQSGSTQFVRDGVEGLVAQDDAGMVAALVRLGSDRPLLERMTQSNRRHPPRESWPEILAAVDRAYEQSVATSAAR